MRSFAVAVLIVALSGCVGSDYGSIDDVFTETRSAVGTDGIEERRAVECIEAEGQERVAASVRFPDVFDIEAAVGDIEEAWSEAWPDGTEQESPERIVVTTPSGVVAATVTNDPVGELRVDLVGPCTEP